MRGRDYMPATEPLQYLTVWTGIEVGFALHISAGRYATSREISPSTDVQIFIGTSITWLIDGWLKAIAASAIISVRNCVPSNGTLRN